MKEKLADLWAIIWRPLIALAILVALAAAIILPGLHEYRAFVSPMEDPKVLAITEKSKLIDSAAFLPQRTVQAALLKFGFDTPAYLRLVSVAMAVSCIVAMYYILRHWYTARVAIFGTILFGTSSWFLHQARSAEFGISYIFAALTLICIGIWASERKKPDLLPLVALFTGLTLYVPGFWLLVLFSVLFGRTEISFMWSKSRTSAKLLSGLLFLGSLVPLAFSLFRQPHQYQQVLGLVGGEKALSVRAFGDNFVNIWQGFFISGVDEPLRWLIGTPILDITSIILLGLGIYSYQSGLHPIRYKTILGGLVVSAILMTLGGFEFIGIALVFSYLFIAAGIGLLLQQWFSVFPRNPFARTVGVLCVAVLVGAIAYFHASRYYIGWSHADSTLKVIIQR